MLERIEELHKVLADIVSWIRSQTLCPIHPTIWRELEGGDNEGRVWRGPLCEWESDCPQPVDCEWRARREELLESAYEVLGTKDMSRWV